MSRLRSMMVTCAFAVIAAAAVGSKLGPTASAQAQAPSAQNVSAVSYPGGQFRQAGPGSWTENNGAFNFVEAGRDASSIFLVDASRGVTIQLNIARRQVLYSDANTPQPIVLYQIVSVSTAAVPTAPPPTAAGPRPPAGPAPVTSPPTAAGPRPRASSAPLATPPTLANEVVAAHNEVRARHGVRALTWSPSLAASAERWAQALKARGCPLEHSTGAGENLWASGFSGAPPAGPGRQALNSWYWCEIGNYNPANPGFALNTGHYTQVVWANTTEIGCAIATCSPTEQKVFAGNQFSALLLVCQYNPGGNVTGQFPQNVRHVAPGALPAGVSCR